MEKLPAPLICITIQNVIDDTDAVEALLAEHPEAEKCIIAALRDALNMPMTPSAEVALKYLYALWRDLPDLDRQYELVTSKYIEDTGVPRILQAKYDYVALNGLLYLLPLISPNPSEGMIKDTLILMRLRNSKQYRVLTYLLRLLLSYPMTSERVEFYLLDATAPGDVTKMYAVLDAIADLPVNHRITMINNVLSKLRPVGGMRIRTGKGIVDVLRQELAKLE